MCRTLDPFEQFANVVESKPRPQIAQVPGLYAKRAHPGRRLPAQESTPYRLVDHLAERPARTAGLGPQLGGDILVQGQRCTHFIMLSA